MSLHGQLQESGRLTNLPKKKMVGNLDPEFVVRRQKDLQIFLHSVLEQEALATSIYVRRFLDPLSYAVNFQGSNAL